MNRDQWQRKREDHATPDEMHVDTGASDSRPGERQPEHIESPAVGRTERIQEVSPIDLPGSHHNMRR